IDVMAVFGLSIVPGLTWRKPSKPLNGAWMSRSRSRATTLLRRALVAAARGAERGRCCGAPAAAEPARRRPGHGPCRGAGPTRAAVAREIPHGAAAQSKGEHDQQSIFHDVNPGSLGSKA